MNRIVDGFPRGLCPVCGKMTLLSDGRHPVAEEGVILPHNIAWKRPVKGVSHPVRCEGGGRLPVPE